MQTLTIEIGSQFGDFFVIRVVCLPPICLCETCRNTDWTDYICRCKCGKTKILSSQKILDENITSCVACQRKLVALKSKKPILYNLEPFSATLLDLRAQGFSYPKMAVRLNELWPEFNWNKDKVGTSMKRLGQKQKIIKRGHWLISDEEVLKLREKGKSYRVIAAAAGVSRTSVHKKVKALLGEQK